MCVHMHLHHTCKYVLHWCNRRRNSCKRSENGANPCLSDKEAPSGFQCEVCVYCVYVWECVWESARAWWAVQHAALHWETWEISIGGRVGWEAWKESTGLLWTGKLTTCCFSPGHQHICPSPVSRWHCRHARLQPVSIQQYFIIARCSSMSLFIQLMVKEKLCCIIYLSVVCCVRKYLVW